MRMNEEANAHNLEIRLVDKQSGTIYGSICRSIYISSEFKATKSNGESSVSKLTDSIIRELKETASSLNLEICDEEDVRSGIVVALLLALAENRIDVCLDVPVRQLVSKEDELGGEADADE